MKSTTGPSAMSHLGICVRNIDRSLAFYRDLVGMEMMKDEVLDAQALGPVHLYEIPPTRKRVVYLRYGSHAASPVLVLTERADVKTGAPTLLDQGGISHLGFSVPDLQAFTQRMLAQGAKPFGPTDSFSAPDGRILSVFFSDPDGMLVQFDEALNNPAPIKE
jgi:catechol 2,3-dioxygenase-like lactoylglutathione lyase family enzyme